MIIAKIRKVLSSKMFQISVSFSLLYLVFRSIPISSIFIQLRTVPITANLLYILIFVLVIGISSIRWQLILTKSLSRELVFPFYAASMMGLFYNLFLPSINGGDAMKWTILPQLSQSKRKILFSIFQDRVIGLSGLMFVGIFCGVIGSSFFGIMLSKEVLFSLCIFFAGTLAVIGVLLFPQLLLQIPLLIRLPKVGNIILFLQERRKETFIGLILTIMTQLVFFTAVWILAIPLGFTVHLWQMILFGSGAFVFASLPLSFSGLGTTELAFLYFFKPLGVPSSSILALTTLLTLYKIVFAAIGWMIGSYYQMSRLATPVKNM